MPENATVTKFQIGSYECPVTRRLTPLWASSHLESVPWPVVVENCPACGRRHVVFREDVQHPPVFGYE
jgi:hypothetical protein